MNKQTLVYIFGAIIVILALFFVFKSGDYTGTKPDPAPPLAYESVYQNLAYTIEGNSVLLQKGKAETESAPGSASKTVTLYFGNEAIGDLNGDGLPDAAFLLTQTGGGSGTFYYVVAAIHTEEGFVGTNGVFLGDRIAPQTTEIKNGEIVVNFAERRSGEPMTATPSVGVSKTLLISEGKLISK